MKTQNKWWDGWDNEKYSGIIFNDLDTRQGFNWQTVLDAADVYPFHGEVKNGGTTIDPVDKPVVCTSNYSPEELIGEWAEQRQVAFKRRFHIVRVQWYMWGQRARSLKWTYDGSLSWRPPEERWWENPGAMNLVEEHEASYNERERAGTVPPEEEMEDSVEE
jgi:hypothetical protein